MNSGTFALRVRRALAKPPGYLLRRASTELRHELDRWLAPARARRFDVAALLNQIEAQSIDDAWSRRLAAPAPFNVRHVARTRYDELTDDDSRRIFADAQLALDHRVDLLGSGPVSLGKEIDWYVDFKSGARWPLRYFRTLDYARLTEPCDVKVPWELSRLQWLIPAGQAHALSGDERYAAACRDVLEQWIAANPYALGVNWACTMEAALRIFTWVWLFRACGSSHAWKDQSFRGRFLTALFLQAEFTERFIERADINGNHFTADAAALVWAGLFFQRGSAARRWSELGWRELNSEIVRQVNTDGVDFEYSTAYHRLVLELFLLPALYRRVAGLEVSETYRERLRAMGRFTAAYMRGDGSSPTWGDNDDARALPLHSGARSDHRHIVHAVAEFLADDELGASVSGDPTELYWLAGEEGIARQRRRRMPAAMTESRAFRESGVFILRNSSDHVFVDCGEVGLAGRGGHGHNDLLSFEALLDGRHVVTDCGCFVYTASVEERNRFRSTACHNTPRIDEQEINRFIRPDFLWNLHNDAIPTVEHWSSDAQRDRLRVSHTGYGRLVAPVVPVRTFVLDHELHTLTVTDEFRGEGSHEVVVPYHLAPGVAVQDHAPGRVRLQTADGDFLLEWRSQSEWRLTIGGTRFAPSYGTTVPIQVVEFHHSGALPAPLTVSIGRSRRQ